MNSENKSIEIKDTEIKEVERILLKGQQFDSVRRDIIKNFDSSFDVNACPGSGKTTVLLAKLRLLIDRMPFEDGKGICVLTHTNVAVDEIKSRLGTKAEILFKYPNYIGTIQGFVHKYLTIPFYKNYCNRDINAIDKYEYEKYLEQTLKDKGWSKAGPTWKNHRGNYVLGTPKLLDKKFIIRDSRIEIDIENLKNKPWLHKETSEIMKEIFKDGFLTYRDSYHLANTYMDSNSIIKDLFNQRFKFVFIDEMQDTSIYQQGLLSKIFNKDKIIVQRFGDKNQSILSGDKEDEKCGWEFNRLEEINSSKRYGESIAKVLGYIKYNGKESLQGNDNVKSVIPHIIVFDSLSEDLVIDKFEDLIELNNLNDQGNIFKVVGRIGGEKNDDDEITMKSYCHQYNKKKSKDEFNYKNELLQKISGMSISEFLNKIMKVIVRSLRKSSKDYSESKLKMLLEDEYNKHYIEFKIKCLHSYIELKEDNNSDVTNVKDAVIDLMKNIFGDDIDISYIEKYFVGFSSSEDVALPEVAATSSSKYYLKYDTVNGVKGETHTATLYLQTKYSTNKYLGDIDQIIDFMDGTKDIKIDREITSNVKEALNIAYVAMSRSTHLLCIAIHIDTIADRVENLESVGYKVVGCTEEIDEMIKQLCKNA